MLPAIEFHDQFRFETELQTLRNHLRAGVIGPVRRIDVDWVTGQRADPMLLWGFQNDATVGGGVILGYLSHVVDYVLWLTSDEPVFPGGVLLPLRSIEAGGCLLHCEGCGVLWCAPTVARVCDALNILCADRGRAVVVFVGPMRLQFFAEVAENSRQASSTQEDMSGVTIDLSAAPLSQNSLNL